MSLPSHSGLYQTEWFVISDRVSRVIEAMKGNIRQAYIGDLLASLRAAIGCKACTNKYKHANVSVRGRGRGGFLEWLSVG